MHSDTWDPGRYEQFRGERERPVHDLLALVQPAPGGRAADLGCGTGRYTTWLHDRAGAAETVGFDTSTRMLAEAQVHASDHVSFSERSLDTIDGRWDVLFASASLQWLPAHERLLPALVERLAPGGQLVFQVPANFDHPTHVVADQVGREFDLEPLARHIDALGAARYAEVLWAAGLHDLDVSLRVYGVAMDRTDQVIDWVSGTLLTRFESRLDPERFAAFRVSYRTRLLAELGDPTGASPYFYAFPRILCRGRRSW